MKTTKKIVFLFSFLVITIQATFGQNVLDGIVIRENTPTRKPIPYTPIREADVMWSKRVWRVMDLREKMNQPFYYPLKPTNGRKCLIDVIKSTLMSGELTAYSQPAFFDDFTSPPMTKSEIEALFIKIDTTYVDDGNGNQTPTATKQDIGCEQIKQYQLKEDWFFDRQRSVMDVRIIGICPLQEKFTETGEFKGYEKMFWIYFPEARPLFSKNEVFNPRGTGGGNDEERRTLDDLFWKRQFASYITKESNVYDRNINEYTTGINSLLEAEKVKEKIFNYEHDLWHF